MEENQATSEEILEENTENESRIEDDSCENVLETSSFTEEISTYLQNESVVETETESINETEIETETETENVETLMEVNSVSDELIFNNTIMNVVCLGLIFGALVAFIFGGFFHD